MSKTKRGKQKAAPHPKWSDLTGAQVRAVVAMISSHADDLRIDRETIAVEEGFDAVGALDALLAELRTEADKRDRMD